jgi:hypothetical protein
MQLVPMHTRTPLPLAAWRYISKNCGGVAPSGFSHENTLRLFAPPEQMMVRQLPLFVSCVMVPPVQLAGIFCKRV